MPKILLSRQMQGVKSKGRLRGRWEEAVDEDAKKLLGTKSWKRVGKGKEV